MALLRSSGITVKRYGLLNDIHPNYLLSHNDYISVPSTGILIEKRKRIYILIISGVECKILEKLRNYEKKVGCPSVAHWLLSVNYRPVG